MTTQTIVPCRSCGAEVFWSVTTNGNKIPIDAKPVIGGNIALRTDGRCQYVTPTKQIDMLASKERFVSHFVTCPQANEWRKKKIAERKAKVLE